MPKKLKIQIPTGMHDILPKEQGYFKKVYEAVESMAGYFNFEKIDTSMVEDTSLFEKGTGPTTEIVEKQMYSFRTKGGDQLTLRPEGTPPVIRSYIEHGMFNLPKPVKLWYFGPFFRYEKPQAGRYRQFHQFGFEVLGEQNPVIDAQIIQLTYDILKTLRFKNLIIEVNSVGDSQCRPYYKKLLTSYLKPHRLSLCPDCRKRLQKNVLRIMDCKEARCQRIVSQAPQTIDHLCQECHNHFKGVLEFLDELELPYRLNPHLVRGLDYYTKTVFEVCDQDDLEGRGSLVGGGRYDSLTKLLGGRDVPGCGMAGGVERIIESIKARKEEAAEKVVPKVFLAQLGPLAQRKSLKLFEEFRKAKIIVLESFGKSSLGPQLNKANKAGVEYSLIFGQREALEDSIIIRDMKSGSQKTVKLNKVVEEIKKQLKN